MQNNECEICGEKLVLPTGYMQSPILLFGDSPGYRELSALRPWIGPAGEVLHTELGRAGIDGRTVRLTNMWLHEPNDECFAHHMDLLYREIQDRKAVMVMGAQASRIFFGKSVMAITGTAQPSPKLPISVEVSMAMVNPAMALNKGAVVGEIRLALTRFADLTRGLE